MKTTIAFSALFILAASATPSLANYFHNPLTGLSRNIGSAPNPKPRDIRENNMPQLFHKAPPATAAPTQSVAAEPDAPRREASNR